MLPHRFPLIQERSMSRLHLSAGITVLAAACLLAGLRTSADEKEAPAAPQKDTRTEPEKRALREFMRVKLDASSKILEGLAIEDFSLIREGAETMNRMSTAEKWRVSNDALYRNFSSDFQRVTQELLKAAQDENLDRAALRWMDATMSCIECHRYARGIFIAGNTTSDRATR
jgi:hypothetical protein